MTLVRDADGLAVAQQGFVVDISERKALEEQLGQAQRLEALGLLAGGIAHDFNNLLTAISGYTGLALEHGGKENDLLRRDLREVRTATARAADLTRQLLAFGRRQVFARTVVDLNSVVLEAHSLLNRVIGEKVSVVTRLDPELTRVYADEGQLGQVLVNLALNARDAMPDGGTLTIGTSQRGRRCGHHDHRHRARDGRADTRPHLRAVLQHEGRRRGHRARARDGARDHPADGRHDQRRERSRRRRGVPGRPARDAGRAGGSRRRDGRGSPRGSETILLVEDEDIVRRLVAEMLEGQGYRVVVATGPIEALDVTEPFDLLFTDVVMPSMSGPELASQLIVLRPGIGVLFTSGYSAAAVTDRSTLIGDLLEKPFTIEQLARKVRDALDARGPAVPVL